MKRYCDHFVSLKPERVSNFIKKTNVRCSFKNHVSTQYNLCLNCGETRCAKGDENNQKQNCSTQHWNVNKHPLVLQVISMQIYCFACETFVLDFQAESASKMDKKKIQKIADLNEKIMLIAQKHLSNQIEKKLKQSHNIKVENSPSKQSSSKKKQTKKQVKKNSNLRIFGLANIGNTCYFNSILQCLYATVELHQFYQRIQYKDDFNILLRKFLRNNQKVFCPKSIFSLLCKQHRNFKGMGQQDAFQLFIFLINSLMQSANKLKSKQIKETVGNIFGFTLMSRLECLNCQEIKWIKDFSLGVSIPLSKKIVKKIQEETILQIPKEQIGQQGLYNPSFKLSNTFLDWFFSPQIFNKGNSYICEKCQQSNSVHRFYIKNPPNILVINFKRFHNNGAKNDAIIHIPQQISLKSYCLNKIEDLDYEIYGAVIHSGSSKAGHYVSYTKRNNQWYYFSDQHVKASNFSALKNSHPYVVFYRRIITEKQQISEIKMETHKSQETDLNVSR